MKKTLLPLVIFLMTASICLYGNIPGVINTSAGVFYFIHEKGPMRLNMEVQGRPGSAATIRFYDAEENLVDWKHVTIKEQPVSVSCNYRTAPPGVYQVRVNGWQIHMRPSSKPEHRFGFMPCSNTFASITASQFGISFFYIPKGAKRLAFSAPFATVAVYGGPGKLQPSITPPPPPGKTNDNARLGPGSGGTLDVSESNGKIWHVDLTSMAAGDNSGVEFSGMPVILCPDRESAQLIAGGQTECGGRYFRHKFQVRMFEWMRRAAEDDGLEVEYADFSNPEKLIGDDTAAKCLFAVNGVLSNVNYVLKTQSTDPANPNFGKSLSTRVIAAAYSIDKPFNPYYRDPAIEKRLLLSAFYDFLAMHENESFLGDTTSAFGYRETKDAVERVLAFSDAYAFVQDAEAKKLWFDGLSRTVDRFSSDMLPYECFNAAWPLILTVASKGGREKEYQKMAAEWVARICSPEKNKTLKTGYIAEYGNPDTTREGYALYLLALYYRMTKDKNVLPAMKTVYSFMNHTITPQPDGTFVGSSSFSHTSRSTWRDATCNAGAALMKDVIPEAAVIAKNIRFRMPVPPKPKATPLTHEQIAARIESATAPMSPYMQLYKYTPSDPAKEGKLPVTAMRNFFKNFDNEFVAVRRPSYYALLYNGHPSLTWEIGANQGLPKPESVKTKWEQLQGLSLLWFEGYGAFVTSMNWEADSLQMLRAELPGGKCAHQGFSRSVGKIAPNTSKLTFKGEMYNLAGVGFERVLGFEESGISQKIKLTFKNNVNTEDFYEQIPIYKDRPDMEFKYLVNGSWTGVATGATEARVNGVISIKTQSPADFSVAPEITFNGHTVMMLRIHIPKSFKAKDKYTLSYRISIVPKTDK